MLKHSNGFINEQLLLLFQTIKYSGFLVSCKNSHHPTLWIHFHLETSSEMDKFGPSLPSAACYFSSRSCDATLEDNPSQWLIFFRGLKPPTRWTLWRFSELLLEVVQIKFHGHENLLVTGPSMAFPLIVDPTVSTFHLWQNFTCTCGSWPSDSMYFWMAFFLGKVPPPLFFGSKSGMIRCWRNHQPPRLGPTPLGHTLWRQNAMATRLSAALRRWRLPWNCKWGAPSTTQNGSFS